MSEQITQPSPGEPLRPVWVYHLGTVFTWLIVIALFFYFFDAVRLIFLGLLAAGAVGAMMRPLMKHVPGPRWLRAIMVGILPLVIAAAIIALLSWFLAGAIQEQFARWPQVRAELNQWLANVSQRLRLEDQLTVQGIVQRIGEFLSGQGMYQATANVATTVLIALVFIFIGSIYFLGEPEGRLLGPIERMMPERRRSQFRGAIDDLEPRLRWWLIGTLISMSVVGLAAGVGFWIIGLQLAIPLALLAALAEIVPTVGPAVAFLIAILFAATQGTGTMIGVVVLYAIIQLLESYVLLPYVMKKAVRIPPLVTLFTVVLWGKVFGPGGLLLALPIDLLIWSFASHFLMQPRK